MVFDIKRLDIYRKIPKDLTQSTLTGAAISICCCCFMAYLFLSEFLVFINTEIVSELFVDGSSNSEQRIPVRLNISLVGLECEYVGLDIQDDLGRHEVGFVETMEKHELPRGGCRFEGRFLINKVPGNFHVSTHSSIKQPEKYTMAHIIHGVSFGDDIENHKIPGSFNTLKDKDKSTTRGISDTHEYVMKVVPTIYDPPNGDRVSTYQYTYAYRSYDTYQLGGRVPAIWFRYDLSPITVRYQEKRQPFYSFLTTICAIVGGTFTVAGIIDSCVFTASEIFKKYEIGKLS